MKLPSSPLHRQAAGTSRLPLVFAFWLLAASTWSACQPGELDTHSEEVAAGVVHHSVHLVKGPWRIHVLEVDLPRAWKAGIRLRTAKRAEGGAEKTSVMADKALAAINGDFFSYSRGKTRVAGLHIFEGCLQQQPHGRSAFAISQDGVPLIAVFRLQAGLITAAGQILQIAAYNHAPGANELSFYNYYSQSFHDSVRAALGFQLQSLGGRKAIDDTIAVRVVQVRRQAWPLLLERGQWLVAAGEEYAYGDRIAPGDTVRFFLRLLPIGDRLPQVGRFQEAIGGWPRILRDGRVAIEYAEEGLSRSFAEARDPRTAIGHSQDGKVLFLVTVDGRQPGYSVGMSLEELAVFMRTRLSKFSRSQENAYQALNLDGGGSTTMVVRQQVVNSPSDPTGERPVANALLVVEQTRVSL